PKFVGQLGNRRSIQIRADNLPLDVDAILTPGPETESFDVDRFVAQRRYSRQDLAHAIDTDPTRHCDTVPNADFSGRAPPLGRQEWMATRGRDLPAGAGPYGPDPLASQWCSPEVC